MNAHIGARHGSRICAGRADSDRPESGKCSMTNFISHSSALVEAGTSIGSGTRVWAFAHVCAGVVIGEDCNLCDHTFLEKGVRVGNRVTIKCGVYLWEGARSEERRVGK